MEKDSCWIGFDMVFVFVDPLLVISFFAIGSDTNKREYRSGSIKVAEIESALCRSRRF